MPTSAWSSGISALANGNIVSHYQFFVVLKEVGKRATRCNQITRDTGQELVPSVYLGRNVGEQRKADGADGTLLVI